MKKTVLAVLGLVFVSSWTAGCATTRPRPPEMAEESGTQVADLERQLAIRDQKILELEHEIEAYRNALETPAAPSAPLTIISQTASSRVRVPGVFVEDVQRALIRESLDPGPVDGKMGQKTISALKEYQRRQGLKADGIVGAKTWSRLKP